MTHCVIYIVYVCVIINKRCFEPFVWDPNTWKVQKNAYLSWHIVFYIYILTEWIWRCCTALFHTFSLDCFHGCIFHKTGWLVEIIVQNNTLFSVMGQETREYDAVQPSAWIPACCETIVKPATVVSLNVYVFYVLVWHRESIIPGNSGFSITKY